jgi:hypothetical protein
MRSSALLSVTLSLGIICGCAEQYQDPTGLRPTAATHDVVAAVATRTTFAGFICFGPGSGGETTITPGDILHTRDRNNVNYWVTGNPLIDGVEHNVVNANIDVDTGHGSIALDLSVKPDAVNGTWEIREHVLRPSGAAHGVGHGTGELQGMTIEFDGAPGPISSGCDSGFGSHIQGTISSPASAL